METVTCSLEIFLKTEICLPHSDFVCCIEKFCKIPCRSPVLIYIKFYTLNAKTCKTSLRAQLGDKIFKMCVSFHQVLILPWFAVIVSKLERQ